MDHTDIQAVLDAWAAHNFVLFASRSDGQRTTDTVSRDALYELIQSTAAACATTEAQRIEAAVDAVVDMFHVSPDNIESTNAVGVNVEVSIAGGTMFTINPSHYAAHLS